MSKYEYKLLMISGTVMTAAGFLCALGVQWMGAVLVWTGGMCCFGTAFEFCKENYL